MRNWCLCQRATNCLREWISPRLLVLIKIMDEFIALICFRISASRMAVIIFLFIMHLLLAGVHESSRPSSLRDFLQNHLSTLLRLWVV